MINKLHHIIIYALLFIVTSCASILKIKPVSYYYDDIKHKMLIECLELEKQLYGLQNSNPKCSVVSPNVPTVEPCQ